MRSILKTVSLALAVISGCDLEPGSKTPEALAPTDEEKRYKAEELERFGFFATAAELWSTLDGADARARRLSCLAREDPDLARQDLKKGGSGGTVAGLLAALDLAVDDLEFEEARAIRRSLREMPQSPDEADHLLSTAWLDDLGDEGEDLRLSLEHGLESGWVVQDPTLLTSHDGWVTARATAGATDLWTFPVEYKPGPLRLVLELSDLQPSQNCRAVLVFGLGDPSPQLGVELHFGYRDQEEKPRIGVAIFTAAQGENRRRRSVDAGVLFPPEAMTCELVFIPGKILARIEGGAVSWKTRMKAEVAPPSALVLGLIGQHVPPGGEAAVSVRSMLLTGRGVQARLPEDEDAETLGNLAAVNGHLKEAEEHYSRGIQKAPFSERLYRLRGVVRARRGQPVRAARDFAIHGAVLGTKSADLDRTLKGLAADSDWLSIARIGRELAVFELRLPPALLAEARAKLRAALIAADPPSTTEGFLRLAEIQGALGDLSGKIQSLNGAVGAASDDERVSAHVARARAYTALAESESPEEGRAALLTAAYSDLQAALGLLDGNDPTILVALARVYLLQGRADQAIEECTRALEADGTLTEAYHLRGLARTGSIRSVPDAVNDLGMAVRLAPSRGEIYFDLALALSTARREDEARKNFERAVLLGYRPAAEYLE